MAEIEYTVTSVRQRPVLDEVGNPVPGYQISFTWGVGQVGVITLQAAQATAENRDKAIREEIARITMLFG